MFKNKIKAVLFDLDGTLIDTEKIFHICWMAAAKDCGYEMDHDFAYEFRSIDAKLGTKRMAEVYGTDQAYTQIRTRRIELMEEYIAEHGVQLKAGALELLDALTACGIPYYIVTASAVDTAILNAGRAGLTLDRERIISTKTADITCGKPDPEVYLAACKKIGLDPSETVAVEDSPNGVRSAHGAGCQAVMVPDLTPPTEEDLKYIDVVCESLFELKDLICRK